MESSKKQITKLQPAGLPATALATAGEEHAKIAIAVVRRPPAAAHALRAEVAEAHEAADSGARIRPGVDVG